MRARHRHTRAKCWRRRGFPGQVGAGGGCGRFSPIRPPAIRARLQHHCSMKSPWWMRCRKAVVCDSSCPARPYNPCRRSRRKLGLKMGLWCCCERRRMSRGFVSHNRRNRWQPPRSTAKDRRIPASQSFMSATWFDDSEPLPPSIKRSGSSRRDFWIAGTNRAQAHNLPYAVWAATSNAGKAPRGGCGSA